MGSQKIGAVVTDLDGTLLTNNKKVAEEDLNVLHRLGEQNILRIAATGRNLQISQEVLPEDFPIDYLVFSTGSGIYDWHQKQIIHADGLTWEQTRKVMEVFKDESFDFTVHQPIPNNYRFYYHQQNKDNEHFNDYLDRYAAFAQPLERDNFRLENACQLLAIIEGNPQKYEKMSSILQEVKLVRTTSPLNNEAIWIEVFPRHISKAWGLKYIKEQYKIPYKQMMGIGNDYNDVDFLELVGYPRVVANAHPDLLKRFPVVASNENCGVSKAIYPLIDL